MKGEVVYLYAFDVANEIHTHMVKDIFADKPVPIEIRTDHTLPKDVPLYKPLSVAPAALAAPLAKQNVRPLIHIYEIGVISISMRVPFEVKSLSDLLPYHKPVLENGQKLEQVARDMCIETCKNMQEAMVQSSVIPEPEAYTVFCLTDIGRTRNVNNWIADNRNSVAELLTESKAGALSDMQVDEVLRITRSYSKNDATVIDWDAALVIDLAGYVDDVLYVLELANLQLEEYRVMDQRLDLYMNRAYEDIKIDKRRLFVGAYSSILRNLRMLRMDVTKLNDEVTHITKFFGDWYLARVYLGARERFYINQWRNSVEERLKQLDDLYNVVHTEVTNNRMVLLEVLIVLFFLIDLIGIFFIKG